MKILRLAFLASLGSPSEWRQAPRKYVAYLALPSFLFVTFYVAWIDKGILGTGFGRGDQGDEFLWLFLVAPLAQIVILSRIAFFVVALYSSLLLLAIPLKLLIDPFDIGALSEFAVFAIVAYFLGGGSVELVRRLPRWIAERKHQLSGSAAASLLALLGIGVSALAIAAPEMRCFIGLESPACQSDTATSLRLLSYSAPVVDLAFHERRRVLAAAVGDDVLVWKLEVGQPAQEMDSIYDTGDSVTAIDFQPRGDLLAIGGYDHGIGIWDLKQRRFTWSLQHVPARCGGVTDLKFSTDGQMLASSAHSQTVNILSVKEGTLLATLEHPSHHHSDCGGPYALAFSPDGRFLVSGGDRSILVWNLENFSLQQTLDSGGRVLAFSPTDYALVGDHFVEDPVLLGSDGGFSVKVWSSGTWDMLATLSRRRESVAAIAVSPDGRTLAVAGQTWNPYLRLWKLQETRFWKPLQWREMPTQSIGENQVSALVFGLEGNFLIAGGDHGSIHFWEQWWQ